MLGEGEKFAAGGKCAGNRRDESNAVANIVVGRLRTKRGGGREGEKNSKTFDSSYRIAPDESVCGRGVFFPRFLASAASPFDAAFDDYRANF